MLAEFKERAAKGFAWNHLYKLVEYGLLNIYTIIVIRHFGPEQAAPYAVFLSLCTTLAMVSAFAVDGVLLRFLPRVANNPIEGSSQDPINLGVRGFLEQLLALRLLSTLVISLFVILFLNVIPLVNQSYAEAIGSLKSLSFLIVFYLFAQAFSAFSTFALIGLLKVKWVFLASLAARSLLLILGLIILWLGELSLVNAGWLFVGAASLNAILVFYWLWKEISSKTLEQVKWSTPLFRSLRTSIEFARKPSRVLSLLAVPTLAYGITTWGSDMLSTVLGRQPDILMLRVMLGEHSQQISYYQAASLIALIAEYIFLFGLSGTLVSIFSGLVHQDEEEGSIGYPRLARARKEVAGFQTVTTLPLFTFVFFFAPQLVSILFGPHFLPAIPLVRLAMITTSIAVAGFGGGMSITSLVVIGKQKVVFKNRLVWGIANLLVNVILIYYFGAIGALAGTQLSNAGACATESYFAKRLIGPALRYAGSVQILFVAIIASFTACIVINSIIEDRLAVLQVVFGGLITLVIITLGYNTLKLPESRLLFDRVRALIQRPDPKLATTISRL